MEEPQNTETVRVDVMEKEVDSIEKADSGMDEDSQHSSVQDKIETTNDGEVSDEDEVPALRLADSDDSDNEDIKIKPKKRMTTILDDDDDDSSNPGPLDESKTKNKVEKVTAEEVLNAVLNSNDTDEDSDSEGSDNEETLRAVTQKKKKKFQVLEESSNDSSVSGRGTDSGPSTSEHKRPDFGNRDLFDAESDSDRASGDEPAQSSHDEADDEGFDESAIDPKLLKQLKKGAARKETVRSKRKAKEEAIINIHSETQRMVRESRVNIPYYNPSPRPLQDFLGRAQQKQQQYKAMKGASHSRKAQLCEEVLSKTRFASPKLSSTDSPSMEVDLSMDKPTADTSVSTQLTEVPHTGADSDNDSLPDLHANKDKIGDGESDCRRELPESKSTCTQSEEHQDTPSDLDFDELPDLLIEEVKTTANKEEKLKMESSFELQGIEDSSVSKKDSGVCEQDSCKDRCATQVSATEVDGLDNTDQHSSAISVDTESSHKCLTEDTPSTKLSNLAMSSLPCLSGGPNSFISLDEDSGGSTPKNREMTIFMDRFLKHSQKKEKKKCDQDIQISVVQKEKSAPDREELKESSFTYHTTPVEENPLLKLDTPGAKLMALKSQLSVVMAQKREKNRQKHQQVYDLDNEAGFEKDEEEALLDDEAEMSEHSDTDVEDDDFEEQFGDADEELEQDQEPKEKNPFMDDEAEDDEDSEKEDGDLNLKLQLSDDEEEEEEEEREEVVVKAMSAKKKSRVLQISDDEDSKDVVCSADNAQQSSGVVDAQCVGVVDSAQQSADAKHVEPEVSVPHFLVPHSLEESRVEEFSPFSKHLASMTTSPTQKKRPNLPPPIEDSQDLYGNNQALPPTQTQSQMPLFYLEDSQSQMLDADGFLKVGSTDKKNVRSFALGNTDNAESSDMDELLGLCSGRFGATQSEDKKSCKSLFGTQQTQGNMDELLGLCSGQFAGSGKMTQGSQKPGMKRKLPLDDDDEEEEEEEFRIVSDGEENFDHNDKNELSDDDDAGDADDTDNIEDSGDEVDGDAPPKFSGFTAGNKHGLIRKDFVDEEAELSGSEYDSDENLDIAEEDDFMEMEEGDKDVTVGEEELRNQVGRAHLKQLIDEDKRELMRFQEMYLQDGDLHSEGAGRKRQFKWRNIDDDTQQDMFGSESEGEKEDEEGENELRWRKERFEREKWLKEQMEQEKEGDESQFFKFGKVFLKRRESETSNTSSSVPRTPTSEPDIAPKRKDTPTPNLFKLAGQKRGSFLSRDKNSLAKIAEFNKGSTGVIAGGPRNSRNLTFQVISPGKDKENKSGTKVSSAKPTLGPKLRKAHTSNTKTTPAAKKPRLEKKESSFSQNSIFNHI